ncbi:MAG: hypothetical protein AAF638_04860 [Pseudomonadota bacterium]
MDDKTEETELIQDNDCLTFSILDEWEEEEAATMIILEADAETPPKEVNPLIGDTIAALYLLYRNDEDHGGMLEVLVKTLDYVTEAADGSMVRTALVANEVLTFNSHDRGYIGNFGLSRSVQIKNGASLIAHLAIREIEDGPVIAVKAEASDGAAEETTPSDQDRMGELTVLFYTCGA